MTDDLVAWAEQVAREQLRESPSRLKHVEGVARQSERVADAVDDPELVVAAAWLYDIGYGQRIAAAGFHPVDGAELREAPGAPRRLCALVANHSCAHVEAPPVRVAAVAGRVHRVARRLVVGRHDHNADRWHDRRSPTSGRGVRAVRT
ncbi:HD domain-containing protein [Nocardia sp. GCM10030253]|uniref:HD domain-containing protein n=1 Tax=Nocardia sp. GCM10030253 TaxID=3273404 RepID=UPI00363D6042